MCIDEYSPPPPPIILLVTALHICNKNALVMFWKCYFFYFALEIFSLGTEFKLLEPSDVCPPKGVALHQELSGKYFNLLHNLYFVETVFNCNCTLSRLFYKALHLAALKTYQFMPLYLGKRAPKKFFSVALHIVKIFAETNCLKIFLHGQDFRLINKIWVQTKLVDQGLQLASGICT